MSRPRPRLQAALFTGALGLAAAAWPAAPAEAAAAKGRSREIVVLRSERWIDTVRGAVKNVAATPADDVTLDVRFRNARKTVLGTQTIRLGPMQPGEEREFQVAMPEPVRSATSWEITPRAVLRPRKR